MARPTAKECFAIIKRSLREGSDEPHSVGSGVPSVVVRHDTAEHIIALASACAALMLVVTTDERMVPCRGACTWVAGTCHIIRSWIR